MAEYIVFLIGPPNSGKSTQAEQLLSSGRFSFRVSPGDWLRKLSDTDTVLGRYVANNWNHDSLEPLVIDHVREQLQGITELSPFVLVDGYPRTEEEALQIPTIARGYPVLVVELYVTKEELFERAVARQRRDDDTEKAQSIRLETYEKNIAKIRPFLQELGVYCRIDSDQDKDAVTESILEMVDRLDNSNRIPIPPQPDLVIDPGALLRPASATESAIVVQKSQELAENHFKRKQFSGSHPISLSAENLWRVRRYPYHVSLKADGVRYLCVVWDGRVWFMGRKFDVWKGPLKPKLREYENSLLDGEMVNPNLFLVLDCLAVNGRNCMKEELLERLRLSVPVGRVMYNGPLYFRPQDYVDRRNIRELLRRESGLSYKCDGLIFTPSKLPARIGIDYNMFKWKPFEQNSIDALYCKGYLFCRRVGERVVTDDDGNVDISNMAYVGEVKKLERKSWIMDGMIVECKPKELLRHKNDTTVVWQVVKERDDKKYPNMDWVAKNVIQSLVDNITLKDVVEECLASPLAYTPPGKSSSAYSKSPRIMSNASPGRRNRCSWTPQK